MAAPIEEQVNGVEGMLSMSSQSANDGSYTLHVTFKAGTDLDMAQVLVQNRVSLALPVIPALVQREGVTVRKKSPEPLLLVSLTSPDGRFDSISISAITRPPTSRTNSPACLASATSSSSASATIELRVIARCRQAGGVVQLSAMDVVTAISQQNIQVAGGPIGQAPVPKGQQLQLTINTLGRLIDRKNSRTSS